VQQGGLRGSAAALTVNSRGGTTSSDEVAYEKGDRLWLVIAGCSASCYDKNQTRITQIDVVPHLLVRDPGFDIQNHAREIAAVFDLAPRKTH
jgi:hypothetical protein